MWNRIAQAIAALGGLAAFLSWMETSQWLPTGMRTMLDTLGPHLGTIVSISLLSLVCIGLWRIALIERRLDAMENRPKELPQTEGQLDENELLDLNMLWKWDRNRHEVIGPLCPTHKLKLAYQPSVGLPPLYADFEDKYLGASGWFVCHHDNKTFNTATSGKVEELRWNIENKFRAKFDLPSKPKRLPTAQELALQRQVAEKLFGQQGSTEQNKQS